MRTAAVVVAALLVWAAPAASQDALRRADALRHYRVGHEHLLAERWTDAEPALRRAIELDPLLTSAHYSLGHAYMALKRYTDALAAYRACREAFTRLAGLARQDAALAEQRILDEIRELRDTIRAVQSGLIKSAQPALTLTRLEQRLRELENARGKGPADIRVPAELFLVTGSAYFRLGALEEARSEYLAAISARPGFAEAHNNLAAVCLQLRQWDEAARHAAAAERAGWTVDPRLKDDIAQRRVIAIVRAEPLPTAAPSAPEDPTPRIEHVPVECVLKESHPRIEATVRPLGHAQAVTVRFRGSGAGPWYSLPLRRDGDVHAGFLPKPKRLRSFEYYVEAVDAKAESLRTSTYSPMVVKDPSTCGERGPSASVAKAPSSIYVEKPADAGPNAKDVPAGFSVFGTAAETGVFDWPTHTSVLALGGLLAGAGGAVVAFHDPFRAGEPYEAPLYEATFVNSNPPPGSEIPVGRGFLALRLHVRFQNLPARPTGIRVDFFAPGSNVSCLVLTGPPPGRAADMVVSGVSQIAAECRPPFTATQVTVSLQAGQALVPGTTPLPLGVTYTFVP